MSRARDKQSGFSAIIVVVLLVVLASIGSFIAVSSGVQHVTSGLSRSGMQAWFSADSAMQWGIYDAVENSSCAGATFVPGGGNFNGISVTVTCSLSSYEEGSTTYSVYELTATATTGSIGDVGHASRTIRASVTDAP